jgi:hypothetical protein
MKKLPKSVSILGRKFKLKLDSQENIIKVAGAQCEGCVDFNTNTIHVWKDLSPADQMLTIFHETQHISHLVSGLSQVTSPEVQEIICESTAQAFFDLIKSLNGMK